jgi:hypothetical protein
MELYAVCVILVSGDVTNQALSTQVSAHYNLHRLAGLGCTRYEARYSACPGAPAACTAPYCGGYCSEDSSFATNQGLVDSARHVLKRIRNLVSWIKWHPMTWRALSMIEHYP